MVFQCFSGFWGNPLDSNVERQWKNAHSYITHHSSLMMYTCDTSNKHRFGAFKTFFLKTFSRNIRLTRSYMQARLSLKGVKQPRGFTYCKWFHPPLAYFTHRFPGGDLSSQNQFFCRAVLKSCCYDDWWSSIPNLHKSTKNGAIEYMNTLLFYVYYRKFTGRVLQGIPTPNSWALRSFFPAKVWPSLVKLAHDLTRPGPPKGSWERDILSFQGSLGWNIIIWADHLICQTSWQNCCQPEFDQHTFPNFFLLPPTPTYSKPSNNELKTRGWLIILPYATVGWIYRAEQCIPYFFIEIFLFDCQ